MKYYCGTPNFRQLYDEKGVVGTKKLLNMIEFVRDMCYQITYFENGCSPIKAIDSKLDVALMQLYAEFYTKRMSFYSKVEYLYKYLNTRLHKAVSLQHAHFCKLYPEYAGQTVEQFIEDTLSGLWDVICPTLCTYELENPKVVSQLLDTLFAMDFEKIKAAQYSVTIEAFGNYILLFVTKGEVDAFVRDFVDVGRVFVYKAGIWALLYDKILVQ